MSNSAPTSPEAADFMAELDAEFGRAAKAALKARKQKQGVAELNRNWHAANPQIQLASGKLESLPIPGDYNWEDAKNGIEQLWSPDARVTTIVHQQCDVCLETTWFTGHEYIRFRGRRRRYAELGGSEHEMSATVLRKLGDCDGNLVAFGPADGSLLPDLVEERYESVRRCPACTMLEKVACDLLLAAQKPAQSELELDIEVPGLEGT